MLWHCLSLNVSRRCKTLSREREILVFPLCQLNIDLNGALNYKTGLNEIPIALRRAQPALGEFESTRLHPWKNLATYD